MVGEMVFLKALVPKRKVLVMKEVMRQIIHNVTKNTATKDGRSQVPVEVEDRMRQLPERCRKHQEKSWRHDEAIFVHWQVVMYAVEEEMQCNSSPIIRKITAQELVISGQKKRRLVASILVKMK